MRSSFVSTYAPRSFSSRGGSLRALVAFSALGLASACAGPSSRSPLGDGDGDGTAGTSSSDGGSGSGTSIGSGGSTETSTAGTGSVSSGAGATATGALVMIPPTPEETQIANFLLSNTISQRVGLPIAGQGQVLAAQALANQLQGYDPGSLIRCGLGNVEGYDAAVDDLGGVTWGYGITRLEDYSKPLFYAGFQQEQFQVPGVATDANAGAGAAVEIVKPDIVAVTESAALFYSTVHGLLVVNLEEATPSFECATQLPGRVNQFFFHEGHLVAMTQGQGNANSYLLHFTVSGTDVSFVETVDLGQGSILDSRRFNDKLVFYKELRLEAPVSTPVAGEPTQGGIAGDAAIAPIYYDQTSQHRALRVFNFGDTLTEELHDTLIDTTLSTDQLIGEQVTPETELGAVVYESRRFGTNMWASDHYFVVTEEIATTTLTGWVTQTYNVCTASHTTETPYQYCWTEYETRPNPDYVEPDNSGGDRGCQGVTLSDCLVQVARVSNETIQVPVGRQCEERIKYNWFCDSYEQQSYEYPTMQTESSTQLFIYEYTDTGFIRVDTAVHEITTEGLETASPDDSVEILTTSTETYDLAVPGSIQTLYFQNGYLYVISQGVLQVYAMGGSSIVRTSTLQVVNESLQSSLFSSEQLVLSDFGWSSSDHSTLKVVSLANPAFPVVEAATHQLPGGHRSIISSEHGIFTIGSVQQFMGQAVNALKLGLFSDPYVEETAYLILGTDLNGAWLGTEESQFFNGAQQRLLLPYSGADDTDRYVYRVGVSRIEPGVITSEGAVVVPEAVERVRPAPTEAESYLTFASNSVEWLTPEGDEWKSEPVLEYLQPFAVYRLTEEDDYVEVQHLGNRCRLYFANATDINQRENGLYSEEFTCVGWPTAFDHRLLFNDTGVEFDDEGLIRILSQTEIDETRIAIVGRPICVLSEELVTSIYVDYDNLPEDADVACFTPEEYQARRQELIDAAAPVQP